MDAVLIDSNARLDIACVTSENKEAGPDFIFGHFGHIVHLYLTCTRCSCCSGWEMNVMTSGWWGIHQISVVVWLCTNVRWTKCFWYGSKANDLPIRSGGPEVATCEPSRCQVAFEVMKWLILFSMTKQTKWKEVDLGVHNTQFIWHAWGLQHIFNGHFADNVHQTCGEGNGKDRCLRPSSNLWERERWRWALIEWAWVCERGWERAT